MSTSSTLVDNLCLADPTAGIATMAAVSALQLSLTRLNRAYALGKEILLLQTTSSDAATLGPICIDKMIML